MHSIRSLYKLLSSYRNRDVFRTLSNIEDGAFYKKNNEMYQGRVGVFMELGYFDKRFKNMSKTQEKEGPQGNILEIFLLDTLKTKF